MVLLRYNVQYVIRKAWLLYNKTVPEKTGSVYHSDIKIKKKEHNIYLCSRLVTNNNNNR